MFSSPVFKFIFYVWFPPVTPINENRFRFFESMVFCSKPSIRLIYVEYINIIMIDKISYRFVVQ